MTWLTMTRLTPRWPVRSWTPYVYAIILSAATIGLRLALRQATDAKLAVLFIVPVVLSAWLGGVGPAVLAALICAASLPFVVYEPLGSPTIASGGDRLAAFIFVLVALLTGSISGQLQRARDAARLAAETSERHAQRAQALANGSQRLAEDGLDVAGVLDVVARVTAELLGDLCVVRLLDEEGRRLLPASVWHDDPAARDQAREALSREEESQNLGLSRAVLETGKTVRASDPAPDGWSGVSPIHRAYIDQHGLRSIVLVPLQARGRTIGILSVAREAGGQPYTDEDQAFLEDLANRAAVAIDNARLYDALHLSEERYRSLVAAATSLSWTAGPDGQFTMFQSAWEAFTGQAWEAQAGWGWVDAIHPDDRPAKQADWERALANREIYVSEGRVWHAPSGSYRSCVARAVPLLRADGSIREWIGAVTDVHERREIRRALAESEERYRRIVELANEGIWLIDTQGRTTFANPRMAAMLQTKPNAMMGKEVLAFCFPEDVPLAAEWIGQNLRNVSEQFDFRFRRADGEELLVLGATSPVTNDQGEVIGALGMFADITERQRIEAALRASEERYRVVSELSSDYAYAFRVSPDGRVEREWTTAAFTRMTGYTPEELDARGWESLGHPDDRETLEVRLSALEDGARDTRQVRIVTKQGAVRWIEDQLQPVVDDNGKLVRVYGAAKDITEHKDVERMQREFLALVTHELKGPLTSLRGFAQLIRRRGAYDERGIETIINQSSHLERLINDLLDAVRVEAGRLNLRPRPVDLGELVRRCVDELRATNGGHDIAVRAPDEPLVGNWDPDRIEQILLNLLSNAIKYAPAVAPIEVVVERRDELALLTVTDHGLGIPAADLPRLFERFFRVESTGDYAQGLGLGLYITRSLVEAHGGRIEVVSSPGDGSSFTVSLPIGPSTTLETVRLRSSANQ